MSLSSSRGVPRNVHVQGALVRHRSTGFGQAVDDPVDRLLVARHRRGRYDHGVFRLDIHGLVRR